MSTKMMLAAIYPPLILLLAISLWQMVAAYRIMRVRGWERSCGMVMGVIVMLTALLLEQGWYGYGRFFPAHYESMSSFVPVVGALKLVYVVALLIWIRAYTQLSEEPPDWPRVTALAVAVLAGTALLVVQI